MEGELGIGGENPVDERIETLEREVKNLRSDLRELIQQVRQAYETKEQTESKEAVETSRESSEEPVTFDLLREYESRISRMDSKLQNLERECRRIREDLAVVMTYEKSRTPLSAYTPNNTTTKTSKKTTKGKRTKKRSAKKNSNSLPAYQGLPESTVPIFGYTEEAKGVRDISRYEASVINNMRAWLATEFTMDIDNPLIALEAWYASQGYTPDEARRIVTLRAAEVYLKRNREQLEKEMKKIYK